MKNVLCGVVALSLMLSGWSEPVQKKVKLTAEQLHAHRAELKHRQYVRTGGFIIREDKTRGKVVYVNAQKDVGTEAFEEVAQYFRKNLKIEIEVSEGSFDFSNVKLQGNAAVFIVNDPVFPPTLVAQEARWALVNVAALKEGEGSKPAYLKARTQKELVRAFSLMMGAGNSSFIGSAMLPVASVSDLDKIPSWLQAVDVMARMKAYVPQYGMKFKIPVSYLHACREGWAPPPTNDVQKAIWDKVHQLPTKPITIKPETKPVKE